MSSRDNSQPSAGWDAKYLASQSVWSLEPNQFVAELDLPVGKMVDLAGGEGRNALHFARSGWEVENVEFSAVALAKFQERAAREGLSVTSTLADAKDVQFQLKPDLVVVAYLQLSWPDLSLALDNALGQIDSGVIFGVWHAARNLTEGFGGPPSLEMLPTPEQLTDWAKSHQLDFEVSEKLREVQTETGPKTAIDVVLRANI